MTLDEYIKSENKKAAARGKRRITDAAFGEVIGLSQAHVNRLRNGRCVPTMAVAAKIASVTRNRVALTDWKVPVLEAAQ